MEQKENSPHICPVCWGQGEIDYYERVSTSATPIKKSCKACNGDGVLWPPNSSGSSKNWTLPAEPLPIPQSPYPSIPMPQPLIPQPLIPAYDEFQEVIRKYLEETQTREPKTLDEEIDDCLNNKDVKRLKL